MDHTLGLADGTYAIVTQSYSFSTMEYQFNDTTVLNIAMPAPKRSLCLKFWYYFEDTSNNDVLKIEVKPNIVSNNTVNTFWVQNTATVQQKQWVYGRCNLYAYNKDKIQLIAKTDNINARIAVDDVLVQNYPCQPLGYCDFETGIK